jgi:hypothetical protein
VLFLHPKWLRYANFYESGREKLFEIDTGPPCYMYINEGVVTILSNKVGKPGQPEADCSHRLLDT